MPKARPEKSVERWFRLKDRQRRANAWRMVLIETCDANRELWGETLPNLQRALSANTSLKPSLRAQLLEVLEAADELSMLVAMLGSDEIAEPGPRPPGAPPRKNPSATAIATDYQISCKILGPRRAKCALADVARAWGVAARTVLSHHSKLPGIANRDIARARAAEATRNRLRIAAGARPLVATDSDLLFRMHSQLRALAARSSRSVRRDGRPRAGVPTTSAE